MAGKYELLHQLGAGGMGVVWAARHRLTGRAFAIKFLTSPSRDGYYARFLQEARVSGFVRHPNIVDVYDVGTAPELDGTPFLVMELLEGLSLSDVMSAGRMSVQQTLAFVVPVVSAIAAAHEAGVVHRDLKPSNLFLQRTATGAVVPKVLDFGISKLVGSARAISDAEAKPSLTRTGTVLGSPLYMSPEQVYGDPTLDGRSDVHALGAILWQCLAGVSLFSEDLDTTELAAQIVHAPRRPLSEVWPECPPDLAELVARAVAVRREERVAGARELLAELEPLYAKAGHVSLEDPGSARQLFPMLWLVSAPVALAHATTVDAHQVELAATAAQQAPSRLASSAGSIAGWADKRRTTQPPVQGGRAIAYVLLGAAALGAGVLGVARLRSSAAAPAETRPTVSVAAPPSAVPVVEVPTASVAASAAPVLAPGESVSAPSLRAAAVPVDVAMSASSPHVPASRSPARIAPHPSVPSAPSARPSETAAVPPPISTSANGAPIVR